MLSLKWKTDDDDDDDKIPDYKRVYRQFLIEFFFLN